MIQKRKKILIALGLVAAVAALTAYWVMFSSVTDFTEKDKIFYIPTGTSFESMTESALQNGIIADKARFIMWSKFKKFNQPKPGMYKIKKGIGVNGLVNMLRSGNQQSILIRIDDARNMYALCGKLGKILEADSVDFLSYLSDANVSRNLGFNSETLGCMIVPNTYDFFWTTTPEDFLGRMKKVYDSYWTDENKAKAKALGMTPVEVGILGSIVKGETAKMDEAPKIAGLYMNRLKIDMPLQADPTAVFASGAENVRRVTDDHTNVVSPYNTYQNKGLPPGPINFTETVYLNAVLNYAHHDYLYMCAQPGSTGYHNFAKTYDQHLEYADEYHKWLRSKGL
jgi:UPF0755 protein